MDLGRYSVRAQNVHGTIESTAKLKIGRKIEQKFFNINFNLISFFFIRTRKRSTASIPERFARPEFEFGRQSDNGRFAKRRTKIKNETRVYRKNYGPGMRKSRRRY